MSSACVGFPGAASSLVGNFSGFIILSVSVLAKLLQAGGKQNSQGFLPEVLHGWGDAAGADLAGSRCAECAVPSLGIPKPILTQDDGTHLLLQGAGAEMLSREGTAACWVLPVHPSTASGAGGALHRMHPCTTGIDSSRLQLHRLHLLP